MTFCIVFLYKGDFLRPRKVPNIKDGTGFLHHLPLGFLEPEKTVFGREGGAEEDTLIGSVTMVAAWDKMGP